MHSKSNFRADCLLSFKTKPPYLIAASNLNQTYTKPWLNLWQQTDAWRALKFQPNALTLITTFFPPGKARTNKSTVRRLRCCQTTLWSGNNFFDQYVGYLFTHLPTHLVWVLGSRLARSYLYVGYLVDIWLARSDFIGRLLSKQSKIVIYVSRDVETKNGFNYYSRVVLNIVDAL